VGIEPILYFFAALYAVGILVTVASVGKPRKTFTAGQAAVSVGVQGIILVWILLVLAGV
jgi:hypothetical protein